MSVHYSNGFGAVGGFRLHEEDEHEQAVRDHERKHLADAHCFLCGETPTYPMVMWAGADGNRMYLHESCAPRFILKLARDAWELENVRGDGLIGDNGEYLGGRRGPA